MRLARTAWYLIFCAAAGVILLLLVVPRQKREFKLADGSILRLEKVYFGKPRPFKFGGLLEELKDKLPKSWIARFSKPNPSGTFTGPTSWYNISPTHTNEDALYIYITRRDADTGAAQNVGIARAQIVDEHGCVFQDTQAGGEDHGHLVRTPRTSGMISSVNWFRFEAFPRNQRKFLVQFVSEFPNQSNCCEVTILNPAPVPASRKNWTPETFPINQTDGNVSFILTSVKLQTNESYGRYQNYTLSPWKIVPAYEIIESGQPSSNWQALDSELYDTSGNFSGNPWSGSPLLCPYEPVWKLRVRFFGSEKSPSASNVVWTLRGLEVPAEGASTNLDASRVLDGVSVNAKTFDGSGEFDYDYDGVLQKASKLKEPLTESKMEWKNGQTIFAKTAHLALKHGKLTEDQRLTVRATDENGRDFYGYEWPHWNASERTNHPPDEPHYLGMNYGSEVVYVLFDLPSDSKKVDLTICLHNCRIPEFIFKPPQLETNSSGNSAAK